MQQKVFFQRYVRPLLKCDTLPGVPFYCGIEWQRQAVHCIQEAYEYYKEEEFAYELIVREKLSHKVLKKTSGQAAANPFCRFFCQC